ncbi:hypothetical protein yc1106_02964 [Curvularia clavata]|uniref:Uncharacterized protein n=1 Tax=Curvularia clavata TaxID=95742 RepID=A0A9Q8Z4T8_CURCL|nr:hypothetical protein yc1106_02964 [Curvularia clavata]
MRSNAVGILARNTVYLQEPSMDAPISTQAMLFPALAFPAWILCIPSMSWHFRRVNFAAGSIILWLMLHNFFNSINALIWPRDNIPEWWDGHVWCDIHVRIQVGSYIGIAASAAMITRKLAKVMDTRNITVSSSRDSKTREKIWEIVWCWGAPMVLIIAYYVVQSARYFVFGIVGCLPAYDNSWPSLVVNIMWFPITTMFATYWSILLIYRLYRYRQEFHRLVAAQNTTKSRFIRLFILGITTSLVYFGYSIYILFVASRTMNGPYSWSRVHDPTSFNAIICVPAQGNVAYDKWIQVITGYVVFLLFGTGVDAHNLYRKILVCLGLGKVWPSLYETSRSSYRTPSSFIAARSWTSNVSSKAKNMLWSSRTDSVASVSDTAKSCVRKNSVVLDSIPSVRHGTSECELIEEEQGVPEQPATLVRQSSFKRWFARSKQSNSLLPLFNRRNIVERTPADAGTATAAINSPGVHAHAWATEDVPVARASEGDGVIVLHELHQNCHDRPGNERDSKSNYAWTGSEV